MRQARIAFKHIQTLDWEIADDYLRAKQDQSRALDVDQGRVRGMEQFLNDKSFRPGLKGYRRSE